MKYIEGIDYWIRFIEFPNMASESVVASHGDGTFTIYINTLFPPDVQQDRLRHELEHIEDDHFFRDDLSIVQIEHQADQIPLQAAVHVPPGAQETTSAVSTEPPRLPNVFRDAPERSIPVFASLDAFMRYLRAMAAQHREE